MQRMEQSIPPEQPLRMVRERGRHKQDDRDLVVLQYGPGMLAEIRIGIVKRDQDGARVRIVLRLRKAAAALDAGGMVVVSDVFFDDDRKQTPPFAIYFAINMMLTSTDGSAHAKTEMARWVAEAGFVDVDIRDLPPPNPHSLVIGFKP